MRAGELTKKKVVFTGVDFDHRVSFRYYFFSDGNPLLKFDLGNVALDPSSSTLLIPWETRMDWYLDMGNETKVNSPPTPINRQLNLFNAYAVKERGVGKCMVTVVIRKDGTVEYVSADDVLHADELSALKSDISTWKILPPLKNGEPFECKVGLPLKF